MSRGGALRVVVVVVVILVVFRRGMVSRFPLRAPVRYLGASHTLMQVDVARVDGDEGAAPRAAS